MRVAVVGHVEWVEFLRVARVPAPGEIVRASEAWAEAAGGGGVAAVQLTRLAGACTLFTALGDDDLGRRCRAELEARHVRVEAALRPEAQRRGVTFVDAAGERTITVIGPRLGPGRDDPLPWGELAETDAVYFVSGDAGAVRAARKARVLVATARSLPALQEAAVELDALVASAHDPSEAYREGDLAPPPRLLIRTKGAGGGLAEPGGAWVAAEPAGPVEDAYGAGDSFAAGLTYALGQSRPAQEALALAARCGAEALARRGAHGR
jgi:ribokinase